MHLARVKIVAMFPPGWPEPRHVGCQQVQMLSPAEAAIQTYLLHDTRSERPLRVESGLTRTEHQGEQEVRQPVKITVQWY